MDQYRAASKTGLDALLDEYASGRGAEEGEDSAAAVEASA